MTVPRAIVTFGLAALLSSCCWAQSETGAGTRMKLEYDLYHVGGIAHVFWGSRGGFPNEVAILGANAVMYVNTNGVAAPSGLKAASGVWQHYAIDYAIGKNTATITLGDSAATVRDFRPVGHLGGLWFTIDTGGDFLVDNVKLSVAPPSDAGTVVTETFDGVTAPAKVAGSIPPGGTWAGSIGGRNSTADIRAGGSVGGVATVDGSANYLWLSDVAGRDAVLRFGSRGGVRAARGWKNALKPKGRPGPELTLAWGGKTDYAIVLPASPAPPEEKAAADLAQWLKEMTGAAFPVAREGSGYSPTGREISVGRTELLRAANLPESSLDLKEEGYAVAARGKTLYLWGGTTRGPVNAVYALLEEDLGSRWYSEESATLPSRQDLRFRPVPRHFVPVLEIRDPYYSEAFSPVWSLRNRANSSAAPVPPEWGGHFEYAMFVHTFAALVPRGQYGKEHPDYFSANQLCLTHPGVLAIVIDQVKRVLRERPNARLISVSPNDGTGYCDCANCRAIDDREGTRAGTLIAFVNKVAEAIEPEFPDVAISTLAYLGTAMPPKTIRPRSNVAVQFCTEAHAWPHPFTPVTDGPDRTYENLKGWSAIGARIHIWDYTTSFGSYMTIMPNLPAVAENIRTYVQCNARGVMLQGSSQCPGGENARLRSWVWAKQLWDPSLDTRKLMRDFCYGYYGDAAEPVWKYNVLLWKLWEQNYAKVKKLGSDSRFQDKMPYAPYLTEEFIAQAKRLFEKAENLAEDDPELLRRVMLEKSALLYVRIMQEVGWWDGENLRHVGRALIAGTPEQKRECGRMIDELDRLAGDEGIVTFGEGAGPIEPVIAKWRELIGMTIPRTVVSYKLGKRWKFKYDPKDEGAGSGWYRPAVNDAGWAGIEPDWGRGWENSGLVDDYPQTGWYKPVQDYTGIGWYRKRVRIPDELAGKKHLYLFLTRPGADKMTLYINGQKAFEPACGWATPLACDAAPFLKPGEENLIAIRIVRGWAPEMLGLWGPVFLVASDEEQTDMNNLWVLTQANLVQPGTWTDILAKDK